MFKCVFDGIRLNFDHLHRVADIPLLSLMIDIARVVQGERRAELARAMLSRSPHSQSISLMLCKDTKINRRFQIFPFDLGGFSAQIRRIDVFNIEDAHARQNSCEHGSALA